MREWLKRKIAPKEMAELERWRVEWEEYRRWLAEFELVAVALDNLRAEVEGKALDACHPPGEKGPWIIGGLRDRMRAFASNDSHRNSAPVASRLAAPPINSSSHVSESRVPKEPDPFKGNGDVFFPVDRTGLVSGNGGESGGAGASASWGSSPSYSSGSGYSGSSSDCGSSSDSGSSGSCSSD